MDPQHCRKLMIADKVTNLHTYRTDLALTTKFCHWRDFSKPLTLKKVTSLYWDCDLCRPCVGFHRKSMWRLKNPQDDSVGAKVYLNACCVVVYLCRPLQLVFASYFYRTPFFCGAFISLFCSSPSFLHFPAVFPQKAWPNSVQEMEGLRECCRSKTIYCVSGFGLSI